MAAFAIIITLALGLAVMVGCKLLDPEKSRSYSSYGYTRQRERYRVTVKEFVIGTLLMSCVFVPSVLLAGSALSIDNVVSYEQFVNGVETRADSTVETCRRGHSGSSWSAGQSNCTYSYNTGERYTWQERHSREDCTTDSKGNRSCTTHVWYTDESAYIYAPYLKYEYRYFIDSSMGKAGSLHYDFPGVYAGVSPELFDASVGLSPEVLQGAPADWLDAKRHLDAGDPRPVTSLSWYKNYILASGDEVLATYSGQIDRYEAAGLLPDPAKNIMTNPISGASDSQAAKVAFVGVSVPSEEDWQLSVMRFNAAFGMQLQGDLRVVVVDAGQVPSSDAITYTTALKAYWQSPAFEKRAIAKNAVIVVIGASGGKVDWAQATTGMPFGNEEMAQWVQDWLPGHSLNPREIFGAPITVIKPGVAPDAFNSDEHLTVTLSSSPGVLEDIMFTKAPFARASMACDDGTCVGYKDLLDKIEPTGGQKAIMLTIIGFLALVVWAVMAFTSVFDRLGTAVMRWAKPNRK
ncbi:MAG: hypothetical protein WBP22_00845 [Candidatus Saccharimonas sp.]